VTDPLGNVTTNAYDSHGNLTSVTSPAPGGGPSASVTHFAYNSLGELTSITDPLGHVTTMTYTTAGLVYTITDAQSNVTTYAYDSHGNRTSVTGRDQPHHEFCLRLGGPAHDDHVSRFHHVHVYLRFAGPADLIDRPERQDHHLRL